MEQKWKLFFLTEIDAYANECLCHEDFVSIKLMV